MMTQNKSLDIRLYPPEAQGIGAFDGGRITETKPVAFPHENPAAPNLGPLFYWAWATAEGYGKIGLHPHKGFEIMSYALTGEIGHYDTLGNKSRVRAGGAQVMQTGSGVSHEEETVGDRTEFFQIWFEPNLAEAVQKPATYREIANDAFPVEERDGVTLKSVLGAGSPVELTTEAAMQDVTIAANRTHEHSLDAGRTLAAVVIDGAGTLVDETAGGKTHVKKKDFAVVHAQAAGKVSFKAEAEGALRLALIEVPANVDYPLYRDGRVAI